LGSSSEGVESESRGFRQRSERRCLWEEVAGVVKDRNLDWPKLNVTEASSPAFVEAGRLQLTNLASGQRSRAMEYFYTFLDFSDDCNNAPKMKCLNMVHCNWSLSTVQMPPFYVFFSSPSAARFFLNLFSIASMNSVVVTQADLSFFPQANARSFVMIPSSLTVWITAVSRL